MTTDPRDVTERAAALLKQRGWAADIDLRISKRDAAGAVIATHMTPEWQRDVTECFDAAYLELCGGRP